jgi:hypothetical protein
MAWPQLHLCLEQEHCTTSTTQQVGALQNAGVGGVWGGRGGGGEGMQYGEGV